MYVRLFHSLRWPARIVPPRWEPDSLRESGAKQSTENTNTLYLHQNLREICIKLRRLPPFRTRMIWKARRVSTKNIHYD